MESIEITTHSAKETQKVARLFAKKLVKLGAKRKTATVVALEGNLGGGKTTFTQGFARGLGIRENILSPTFVILKSYKLKTKNYKLFFHMDAYRLNGVRELHPLGWQDILKDKDALVLVEWADKICRALPREYIRISFKFLSEHERKILIQYVRQHKRKKE